jgi:hypothetical protein
MNDLGRLERACLVVGGFVAACVVEVTLVTMQAWRRVPSHFNRETPFDSAVSTVLAAGGAVIVVTSVAVTVLAFRPRPALSGSRVLALRGGLLVFLVALGVGVAMIAGGGDGRGRSAGPGGPGGRGERDRDRDRRRGGAVLPDGSDQRSPVPRAIAVSTSVVSSAV